MIKRPVVLLSFANQEDDYLPMLKQESDLLNDILSHHHDKEAIEVYREESTNVENIMKSLNRFHERIVIFHYAGHANGQRLHFEGGGGDAEGVAEFLGQLPNLKLVFLNGCSTMPQVKKLLSVGVPAVIATATEINDEKAVHFAQAFYRAFSNHLNVETAFYRAVAYIRTKHGGQFGATIVRKGDSPIFWNKSLMPWGLHLNEQQDSVLKWTIPNNTVVTFNSDTPVADYQINHELLAILYDKYGMIRYVPRLDYLAYDNDGNPVEDREALSIIIENMPWPIGVQIRLLATKDGDMDKPSVNRIKQIVSTYVITTQFLFYMGISQLWDEKRDSSFDINTAFLSILTIQDSNFNRFDFLHNFIITLKNLLDSNSKLYAAEFKEFLDDHEAQNSELKAACDYLQKLRLLIANNDLEDLEQNKLRYSKDGEYHLSTLLLHIAFLARYDLITIRNIFIDNPRHLKCTFKHQVGRLNAKVSDLAAGKTPRAYTYDTFVNNSSVVITPDVNDPSKFLNLTPFIIDRNAYGDLMGNRATEQQLYVYAYRDEEEFRYLASAHNIYKAQERVFDQLSTAPPKELASTMRSTRLRTRRSPRRSSRRGEQKEQEQENPFEVLKRQFLVFEQDMQS
ncbi:MAG: CHAT domain-containing protein [Saprospiraceae bacterium]|nr:CHAT domain-containing protein [Saprospiraceae bacterium]